MEQEKTLMNLTKMKLRASVKAAELTYTSEKTKEKVIKNNNE